MQTHPSFSREACHIIAGIHRNLTETTPGYYDNNTWRNHRAGINRSGERSHVIWCHAVHSLSDIDASLATPRRSIHVPLGLHKLQGFQAGSCKSIQKDRFCSFNVDCSWNRPIGVAVTQNTDIPVIKVNGK